VAERSHLRAPQKKLRRGVGLGLVRRDQGASLNLGDAPAQVVVGRSVTGRRFHDGAGSRPGGAGQAGAAKVLGWRQRWEEGDGGRGRFKEGRAEGLGEEAGMGGPRRCSKGQEGPGITEDEGFRRRRDSPVRCARGILVLQSSEPGKKCAGGLRGARRSFCGGSSGLGGGEAVSARWRGALLRAEARRRC